MTNRAAKYVPLSEAGQMAFAAIVTIAICAAHITGEIMVDCSEIRCDAQLGLEFQLAPGANPIAERFGVQKSNLRLLMRLI